MTLSSGAATVPLRDEILKQIEVILHRAEEQTRPLEVDPARNELFVLFVTAHGAGFLEEEAEVDLSADELCKILAERWGLAAAAQASVSQQLKMGPEDLAKMRLLWSLMRMWMEWNYAWQRWDEFHTAQPESA